MPVLFAHDSAVQLYRAEASEGGRIQNGVFLRVLPWILLVPLLYLILEGATSFLVPGKAGYGGLEQDAVFLQGESVPLAMRLVTAAVWMICAFAVLTRFRAIIMLAWEMKGVSALSLLTLISSIWSAEPALTFLKSLLLVSGTLFAFYFCEKFTPNEQMEILLILGAVVLVASVIVSLTMPQIGLDIEGAWRGIFNHKNKLGRATMLLLPPILSWRASGAMRIVRLPVFLLALLVIFETQSRTAWIITIVYLGFHVMLRASSRIPKRDLVTLSLFAGGSGAFMLYLFLSNFSAITHILGKDPTMSGRTEIWRAAISSGLKQPMLGFGFGAFWRGVQGESLNVFLTTGFALWQGHNAYLDIWLDLGFVGLGLFAITFFAACRDAYLCLVPNRPREFDWYLGTIFITVCLGMTQGQLMYPNSLAVLLYFISCTGIRRLRLQLNREMDASLARNIYIPAQEDIARGFA